MFTLSKKAVLRILLASMAVFWLLLLWMTNKSIEYEMIWGEDTGGKWEIQRDILLSLFSVVSFLYFRIQVSTLEGLNFNELLWKGFVRGALAAIGLIVSNASIQIIDPTNTFFDFDAPYPIFVNNFYLINVIFVVLFVASTFYIFKRMIMYQKTKVLAIAWGAFEIATLVSLVLNNWDIEFLGSAFLEILLGVSVFALILSVNVKWVAYLNFKQKLRSIAIILAILMVGWTFIQYIIDQNDGYNAVLEINLGNKMFFIITFSFVIIYSISSLLVILFNLPTSSVFEQKFGEVYNFQRLSQSIKMGDSEEQVYDVIIDGSMSTVLADACWLEIDADEGSGFNGALVTKNITEEAVTKTKDVLSTHSIKPGDYPIIKNLRKLSSDAPYRSVLTVTLHTYTKNLGTLYLVRKIADGFDKELLEVLNSFIGQASVSIENSRLIKEAIETERYKEELKIAKSVQRSLLPEALISNEKISMSAFSESANEVGGDYYDLFNLDEDRIAVVIGDVSGHGTQAAFNMAQLKGVFQSLIQLKLSPEEFMIKANNAIGRCFEKSSFVTLSLYHIDLKKLEITYARAGHCPTLLYTHEERGAKYLETKGLGLGILRNEGYQKHIGSNKIKVNTGDSILLYTDGIVEAMDKEHEEYGFDRLLTVYQQNIKKEPQEIIEEIRKDLNDFTGEFELADDYTMVAIKF